MPEAPVGSSHSWPRGARLEAIVVGAAIAVFCIAACVQLDLPGLQYDECLAAAPAVNFVFSTEVAEPMQIGPSVIHIFRRPLPIMVMSYIGPVKTLAHVPFIAALGASPTTVRLMPVSVVALCLLLTWSVCRLVWGRRVAVLAAALVALDPSWVFYLTRDVGPAALAVLFKLLAVAAGIGWWRRGRSTRGRLWLAAAALALGLGVSHKVDFLWIVAGLLLPVLLLAARSAVRRLDLGSGLLATGAFLVGAAPIVAFNVVTGGHTFTPFLAKLVHGEGTGGAADALAALGVRLQQLPHLPSGTIVERLFVGSSACELDQLETWIRLVPTGAIILGLAWLAIRSCHTGRSSRLEAGLLIHIAVVLAASCFSPTALNAHHLLTLYPAGHIVLAIALARLLKPASTAPARLLGALVVTAVLLANSTSVVQIHRGLNATGGVGYWSNAITDLAEDLAARAAIVSADDGEAAPVPPVYVMDWGFTNSLIVLTAGNVPLEPVYRQLWRHPPSRALIAPYVAEGASYLFHVSDLTLYDELPALFAAVAESRGLELAVEARYFQRNGREVYRLVRLIRPDVAADDTAAVILTDTISALDGRSEPGRLGRSSPAAIDPA